ncbi:MAG: beta-ketoacyl-ACP synthase II [Vampirovibrionales bacterium]
MMMTTSDISQTSARQAVSRRRVAVTGMGVVSPVGHTPQAVWENVSQGRSGIKLLTGIPEAHQTCWVAGQITDFEPGDYMDKKEAKRMDRFAQFGVAAARGAWDMSGLEALKISGTLDMTRVGVVVGTGSGGMDTIHVQMKNCFDRGFQRCSPFLVPMMISNMAAGRVSIEFGAKGPSLCITTACATGTDCIGRAMKMIQSGEIDVAFAGGAEAPLASMALAGFANARALSLAKESPETASRPFDKSRNGFVIAEGAAVLMLEDEAHALARGAKIYGYIAGYGSTDDAYDIVATHDEGEGGARAMQIALNDAGLSAPHVGYINAHATSTPVGDISETRAIKTVFGEAASSGQTLVSSTKSMHGHLLGGAGALEAIICLQALAHQVVPPTMNLHDPDEACDLDYVPNVAREVSGLRYAMSNSFGFGGHNASIIMASASV